MPQLSVVIPVRNAPDDLRRALKAVATSTFQEFELIVVDDCSRENAAAEIAGSLGTLFLRTSHRMGPAGARNLDVRHARAPIVVFADSDVEIPPDALSLIAAQFEVDTRLAVVFGSYDDSPGCTDFLSQYKNLFHHYVALVLRASNWQGAYGRLPRLLRPSDPRLQRPFFIGGNFACDQSTGWSLSSS